MDFLKRAGNSRNRLQLNKVYFTKQKGRKKDKRKKERLTLYILVNMAVRGTSSMENRQPSL